jgi:hypothetical protein
MEKLIAGVAINEFVKKNKEPKIGDSGVFISYGCWTTGLSVIALCGHSTYIQRNGNKYNIFNYQKQN